MDTSVLEETLALHQKQSEMLVQSQRQMTNALLLPAPELTKFSGDSMEFVSFVKSFNTKIVPNTGTDADRMEYLFQCMEGEPKKLIKSCTFMDGTEGYKEAMRLLHKTYGDPYKVATAYVEKVLKWSEIKRNDAKGLAQLSMFLIECNVAMRTLSYMDVLDHIPNIQAIILKLPDYLQNKWVEYARNIRHKSGKVKFGDVVKFVDDAAEIANDPAFSKQAMRYNATKGTDKDTSNIHKKPSTSSFATTLQSEVSTKDAIQSKDYKKTQCAHAHCCPLHVNQ